MLTPSPDAVPEYIDFDIDFSEEFPADEITVVVDVFELIASVEDPQHRAELNRFFNLP